MDSDPSQIPVVPIPFEHGLTYFAQSLTRGQAKIVAIGSSTTAGDGQIKAYPERVLAFLQVDFPKAGITMVNKGISGQEAPGPDVVVRIELGEPDPVRGREDEGFVHGERVIP